MIAHRASHLPDIIGRLWAQHLRPCRRRQAGFLLVLMVISGFAEVASLGALLPFLAALADPGRLNSYEAVGKVTNWIGIESPEGLSLALAASFCLIALIAGAIRTLVLWASTRLAYAVAGDISNAVYRRTLYQPYSVHVGRNSSEVISGLSVKVGNVPAVLQQMLALISSVLLLLFVAGALLWINPLVATLVGVGFGGTYVLITGLFRSRLRRNSQDIAREKNRLVKVLQEGLGGIRDVLLGHLQEVYCEAYRRTDDTLRKAQISNVFIGGSPRFVMETSGMVLIAGFSFALTQLSGGLAEALPVLGALALGAQRMLPALQQSYSSWVGIAGSEASLADVLILLDQPLPPEELNTPTAPAAICRSIRLEGVRYDYGSLNPVRVIDGVDIEILKGARVGIVGATGSGKSTLVDLMMGLLEPTEGVVYVDDQPLLGVQRRAWQQTIGHVPQNIFLTDATAAENIAFGVPVAEIDLARVQFAARQAQISDYFETIPLGYSTIVGERGVRLSGGQRQRIGIARALYRRSSVLFFDEATSALDGVTEHAVIDAIERLDRQLTVIIVAHRLSTVRACDYVVQIESGKVIAKGSFDELVASSATFRRMTEPTNNLS